MEFDVLFFVTAAAVLIGLLGSVLPGIPGVPLIFVSALVYAYFTDFAVVGAGVLVLLGIFAALAVVADLLGTVYGARRFGASGYGTIGGAVGGLLGTLLGALVFGVGAIFGLILGSVAGVFAGEYLKRNRSATRAGTRDSDERPRVERASEQGADWGRVSRAAGGVFVGYVISAVAQGTLGLTSVVVFALALFL
jgi:uncharacterized protein YqgC (DUF456 family)